MTATITDLFCGAGGSSLGATHAGADLVMAANHWQTAIDVHQQHFPNAGHDCADISQADPRRYPRTDILLASPECFTAGHLVTTSTGQVPIEDVTVGMLVLTHTGRWRPVVRVQNRLGDTVIVKGQGHTGIECTSSHSFWARASHRQWDNTIRDYRRTYSPPGWIPAGELVDRRAVWSTPVWAERLPDVVPELVPPAVFGRGLTAWWLVGRWLGDGSLTVGADHKSVELSCGFHETFEVRQTLAATGTEWSEHTKRTATTFAVHNGEARDWLLEHCGRGATTKQVPAAVLTMDTDVRAAVLEGYMSADGGTTQRRHRCSTVSRSLAISVRLLAESLGHRVAMAHDRRTTYSIEGRTGPARLQWILHWQPQLSATRAPEAFVTQPHAWSRVRSVTEGRLSQTVYNIEVAVDHSYVLDGIVVKNCTNHSQARGVSRKRYGWAPITTSGAGNVHERTPGNRARPVTDPLPVQQTTATTALATPPGFLFQSAHGGRVADLDDPHPTVCASDDRHALVVPLRRNGHAAPTARPVPTVAANGTHHGLLMRNNGTTAGEDWATTPTTEPARTMTTKGHQSLLVPYHRTGHARTVDQPTPTQTTRDRVALVNVEQIVDDCGFRMLEPYEVAAAMAFPAGYIPRDLPKKDQIKLAGNAVTPPVMTWIVGRLLQAMEARP